MNKKLLAVAVASILAAPATALAQVTLFGTIDGGVRNQTKAIVGTGDASVMTVTDGLRTTNRWGMKGSEDLGGGLMANFWLEGGFDNGTGLNGTGLNFARKSVVGLSGSNWTVDIGRDYTVNFKAQGIYDPMSYTYTGITPTATTNVKGTRTSNMVTAGFRFGTGGVRVDYGMSETPDDPFGTSTGFMADYAFGPVTLTGALSTVDTSATTSVDTTNFGVAWKLGALTLRAGVSNTETETGVSTADTETPMLVLGVQYAISPTWNGRIGYYDTKFKTGGVEMGTRKVTIVAMDYVMSKRTTAYFAFDRTGITGTAPNTVLGVASVDGATGISAGIAHAF
jgi:predicted porin